MASDINYIRNRYKVPAKIGKLVTYRGQEYRIAWTKGTGLLLRSEKIVHPTDSDLVYSLETQPHLGSGKDLQPTLKFYDRAIENIRQHISECEERLKFWREDLRDRPDEDSRQMYREEKAFRDGLQHALDHLLQP